VIEENIHGLIEILWHFTGSPEENHRIDQSEYVVSQPEFERSTSQIRT
jgi:hypothetical protein